MIFNNIRIVEREFPQLFIKKNPLILSADIMFNIYKKNEIIKLCRHCWSTDPFTLGGYSYPGPQTQAQARNISCLLMSVMENAKFASQRSLSFNSCHRVIPLAKYSPDSGLHPPAVTKPRGGESKTAAGWGAHPPSSLVNCF